MKKIIALASVLFICAAVAQPRGVQVRGVGNASCGEYLHDRSNLNKAQDAIYASWIWGYIAGFNLEVRRPTSSELPDGYSTLAYLDKYCRDHPLESVIAGGSALIRDLGGERNSRK